MDINKVKVLVLTGYGLNCDYETDFAFKLAGAVSHRVHINELIQSFEFDASVRRTDLDDYHIMVFDGGFSWGDDHGAGVILAARFKYRLGDKLQKFIGDGKLIIGICNGFQALVNLGLLPALDYDYNARTVALLSNDQGNFRNDWVTLRINPRSPCVFTKDLTVLELPIRHAEGKFYAERPVLDKLFANEQVVIQYATSDGKLANGRFPYNPNGSLEDIAGICDPTGRIFGLMPHPEAYNHYTNHPDWVYVRQKLKREGKSAVELEAILKNQCTGIRIFRNAVEYIAQNF